MTVSRSWAALLAVMAAVVLMSMSGCDTAVDPFATGDRKYSVIGLIDAGRDTQFVRVARLDDSTAFGSPPEPLGATVTTEHLATGETITWNDSLFAIETSAGGDVRTRYVHNFWTTDSFATGEDYRFVVRETESSAETAATATVSIPEPFMDPIIIPPDDVAIWAVRVQDVDYLVDVVVTFRQRLASGSIRTDRISFIADTTQQSLVPYIIGTEVPNFRINRRIQPESDLLDVQVRVVVGNENWPDTKGLSPEELLQPALYTSVENGNGYLAGAISKQVTLCRTPESPLTEGFRCEDVRLGGRYKSLPSEKLPDHGPDSNEVPR